MPTKEQIDEITTNMVAQVHTKGMLQKTKQNKVSGIFIKKIDPKKVGVNEPNNNYNIKVKNMNKRWEAKKGDTAKDPKVQANDSRKEERSLVVTTMNEKKKNQNIASSFDKKKEIKGMSIDNSTISPIDMLLVLS